MPGDRSSVPVAVLLDYDGTISIRDVGDDLMTRFVADQPAVEEMDARYVAGDIGSRELMGDMPQRYAGNRSARSNLAGPGGSRTWTF